MEQMLMVESVKGTPNSSAAWAASISPSACCMPVKPVGASATGIDTFSPIMVAFERAVGHVDEHALAQLDLVEILLVGAVGAFGPGAGIGIVEEHFRHAAARPFLEVGDRQVLLHTHAVCPRNIRRHRRGLRSFRAAIFYGALSPLATDSSAQSSEIRWHSGTLPADEFLSSPLKKHSTSSR
jgi:hypothetical protein